MGFDVRCGLVGKVKLAEDEAVEVTDGQDMGAPVVGEVDGEGLFCAEDDTCKFEVLMISPAGHVGVKRSRYKGEIQNFPTILQVHAFCLTYIAKPLGGA